MGRTTHSILVLWRRSVSSWIFSVEGQEKHCSEVIDSSVISKTGIKPQEGLRL